LASVLFLPIWVIYLQQQRGLSLSQAAPVDVTFFVAAALAELPTGIVADRHCTPIGARQPASRLPPRCP
jgi:hypothetical protein